MRTEYESKTDFESKGEPVDAPASDTEEKERRCLMCGRDFLSEWAGNRVCKKCQSTSTWKRGY